MGYNIAMIEVAKLIIFPNGSMGYMIFVLVLVSLSELKD